MKTLTSLYLFILSVVLFSIVRSDRAFGETQTIETSPAVGSIQTRDRHIVIKADETYTILSNDGKVLFENVTLEQLQAKNPALSEAIEESIAKETIMMDARIGDRWHQ